MTVCFEQVQNYIRKGCRMTKREAQRRVEQRRATVTVPEAAEILGVGRNQAYEGVKNGQIPVIRIGHRLLVPMAALERMLKGAA